MMNPNSWDPDPGSGSFYCPRWLQPFVFWCMRRAERIRKAFNGNEGKS